MESNVFEKSMNNSLLQDFLHIVLQGIVRICNVVDQFLRKPIWFFERIFCTQVGDNWEAGHYKPYQTKIIYERKTWHYCKKINKKISKSRKAAGLNKIPPEVWKTRKFDDILLQSCNAVYKNKTTEK